MSNPVKCLFLSILFWTAFANAKVVTVLFIGNSYVYLPGQGTSDDPALPKMFSRIVRSIDTSLEVKYSFNTVGSYTFERHFNDSHSQALLQAPFDHVILQGNSIESLELPPDWDQFGIGVHGFSRFLPKIVNLTMAKNSDITLFVNWGWNFKHSKMQPGAPGLLFPQGTAKAGQPWCGKDKFALQRMIDESYKKTASALPVSLSMVGDAWLSLQAAGLVNEDELYVQDDWSHPSILGAYVEALVLTKDVLKMDISKATYQPPEVDALTAKKIRDFLSTKPATHF